MSDIGRGDAEIMRKRPGEIGVEPVEVCALLRAGDQHAGHARFGQNRQHAGGAGNYRHTRQLVEITGFALIKFIALGIGGLITLAAAEEQTHGGATGHPLEKIELLLGGFETQFAAETIPGAGMIAHGVNESAIHVDQRRLRHESVNAMAAAVGPDSPVNCFLICHNLFPLQI